MWPKMRGSNVAPGRPAKLKCGFVNMCKNYWMTQMWPESSCEAQMWLRWHVQNYGRLKCGQPVMQSSDVAQKCTLCGLQMWMVCYSTCVRHKSGWSLCRRPTLEFGRKNVWKNICERSVCASGLIKIQMWIVWYANCMRHKLGEAYVGHPLWNLYGKMFEKKIASPPFARLGL